MKRVLGILLFLIGLSVILYPQLKKYSHDKEQNALIESFEEAMDTLGNQNDQPLKRIVVTTILKEDDVLVTLENENIIEPQNSDSEKVITPTKEVTENTEDVGEVTEITEDAEEVIPRIYTREERNQYITAAWPVEGILEIEKIDLKIPIIEGTEVEYLDVSPCSVKGSSKPWEAGNYSIAGHRSLTYGRHFNRLNELVIDDLIVIKDFSNIEYSYVVYDVSIVHETDISVLENRGYDEVTLITCDPIGEKNPQYRLIVKAKKIDSSPKE
ncbi:MAG: class D sortase [Clostridiales bacterium]|nr:class D sortase [Clostridiales bacterium]